MQQNSIKNLDKNVVKFYKKCNDIKIEKTLESEGKKIYFEEKKS